MVEVNLDPSISLDIQMKLRIQVQNENIIVDYDENNGVEPANEKPHRKDLPPPKTRKAKDVRIIDHINRSTSDVDVVEAANEGETSFLVIKVVLRREG